MKSLATSLPSCPDTYRRLAEFLPEDIRGQAIVLEGFAAFQELGTLDERKDRSLRGLILELLIIDALGSYDIRPIYHQATILNVPATTFDIVLYHPQYPVVISCKTSLRERYKQANMEGMMFKQIYRRGNSVLVTLSNEGYGTQDKIEAGDIIGLDKCIVIEEGTEAFSHFLEKISSTKFQVAVPVEPVSGPRVGD